VGGGIGEAWWLMAECGRRGPCWDCEVGGPEFAF